MSSALSMDNAVFSAFAFYSVVCVLKMFAVMWIIVFHRVTKNILVNPEDIKAFTDGKVKPSTSETVERVRRNHANDIENILPFFIVGLLYVSIGPAAASAMMHFRIFTLSRIGHTVAYLIPLPSPTRTLCFGAGFMATASMAVQVIMATM